MREYLVLGYKLTPNAPTLTEARDALLLAAYVNDPADFSAFWLAFARRGAGAGAISPDRFASDNATVVESFVTGGMLAVLDRTQTVEFRDCDSDGYLDNGEVGEVNVTFTNNGSATLSNTTVTLSSSNPHLSFPTGNSTSLAPVAPFAAQVISIPVELLGAGTAEQVTVTVTYNDPGMAVAGPYQTSLSFTVNVDEVPSFNESVETLTPPWTPINTPAGGEEWSRITIGPGDHRFGGPDQGFATQVALVSPPLQLGSGNFTFSFQHQYDFETDVSNFYDGGVVEISTNNGATWTDVGLTPGALLPGYTAALFTGSDNPLSGRRRPAGPGGAQRRERTPRCAPEPPGPARDPPPARVCGANGRCASLTFNNPTRRWTSVERVDYTGHRQPGTSARPVVHHRLHPGRAAGCRAPDRSSSASMM